MSLRALQKTGGAAVAIALQLVVSTLLPRVGALFVGSGSSSRAQVASRTSAVERYHPGHAPGHVTRLHRYDHSGWSTFLEREAAWEAGTLTESEPRKYLQFSQYQTQALNDHHDAWHQQRASVSKDAVVSHMAQPDPAGKLSTLQQSTRSSTGLLSGQAVTGLSSLSSQYVGPLGVGTVYDDGCPGAATCVGKQESNIWAVFDTGSTNIWISSDLCQNGACAMEGRQRYNHTRSQTYSAPSKPSRLTVQFGTGKLIGPQGIDDLHIGPFTVHNQTFALMEVQNGSVFESVPFEGIVGLAFPAMSANKVAPFFDNIINQKVLGHNEFGVYFSPNNPTANAIFWGGVDRRFYQGDIEYFPVKDPYYWSVGLHSFKIGNETLLGSGDNFNPERGSLESGSLIQTDQIDDSTSTLRGQAFLAAGSDKRRRREPTAILDTGTTYFTAEGQLFDEIMNRIPAGSCDSITAETHPPLTYTLKNAAGGLSDLTFTNEMYMVRHGEGTGSRCSPAFMRIDIPEKHGPAMVMGETMMRNYFTVYDRGQSGKDNEGRIGIAKSIHGDESLISLRQLTAQQPSFMDTRTTQKNGL